MNVVRLYPRRIRFRRTVAALTAAAIFASTLPAFAQKDDHVTVVLKSGAKYRGVLVEEVPNDHVTIQLATGEVKTFRWDEVERGSPAAQPVVDEPRSTFVRLGSQPGVVLERMLGTSEVPGSLLRVEHFAFVCRAPCNITVPDGTYRIAGEGLRPSRPFALTGPQASQIDASLGSRGWHTFGVVLGISGAAVAALSGLIATMVPTEDCTFRFNSTAMTYDDVCRQDYSGRNTMLAVAGVAGVLSIVGVVVAVSNGSSVSVGGREVAKRKTAPLVAFTPAGLVF